MVGDLFLQEALPQTAELAAVRSSLASADIAFGNLETPVSTRGATDREVDQYAHAARIAHGCYRPWLRYRDAGE